MSTIDNKINDYINDVCGHVKNKKVHKLIKLELLCHFDEIIEDCLTCGMSKDESINQAILQMGPSNIIGVDLNKAHKTNSDWILLFMTSVLVTFGLFTLSFIQNNSSSSSLINSPNLLIKSGTFLIISILVSLIFIKIDFRSIKKYSIYLYTFSALLIPLTQILSPMVNGAKGWLIIGPITFNTLNISTLLLIISLAGIFDNYDWNNKKLILKGITLAIIPSILFLSVPSTSSMILYLISAFSIMILSGLKVKALIISAGTLSILFFSYIFSADYRVKRLFIFLNPSTYPDGSYSIYNQLLALKNSAGILGKQNSQALSSLPEAHTDFVLTSILYSFGWLVTIILISVILAFIIRIIFIGIKTKSSYGKLLICGVCTLFSSQFIICILSGLSLFPALGISMPFISYGGTQLLISVLSISLVNNIYKNRNTPYLSSS